MYTTIYKLRGHLYKVAKTHVFSFKVFFNTTLLFFKITYTGTDRFSFPKKLWETYYHRRS